MPRGRMGTRPRRKAIAALRFEQMCREIQIARRAERTRQSDEKLRQQTSGWVELRDQTAALDVKIEMQAMELRLINEDRRIMGRAPIDILPIDGTLGDMRRPEDDWRHYR